VCPLRVDVAHLILSERNWVSTIVLVHILGILVCGVEVGIS
jgi:hypothetical protein